MTQRDRTDLRKLREDAAKLPGEPTGRPQAAHCFFGEVIDVDASQVPPLHTIMVYGGAGVNWVGWQIYAVGIRGATLGVGDEVCVQPIPGAGWVAAKIASQQSGATGEEVPNHAHSNADGDGGQTIHGFSY